MSIIIRSLVANDASYTAHLHITGIASGFISSLGPRFVTALYRTIAQSNYSFGFVACEDESVLGFVTFTTNLGSLYKTILYKGGVKLAVLLGFKLCSWRNVKKIFETLRYPKRITKLHVPDAELLSIAVDPAARGKGVAGRLVRTGLAECASRGIKEVKVLVAAENTLANQLYVKCGFELTAVVENHGVKSNIYVANCTLTT